MRIYVGNLSYDVTDQDLNTLFSAYGKVTSASVAKDSYSGRSRGFGFAEMPDDSEAEKAIAGLAGHELKGRGIVVNQARPREAQSERGPRRHGYSGSGGGRSSGGGGRGGRW